MPLPSNPSRKTSRLLGRFAFFIAVLLVGVLFFFYAEQQRAETSRSSIRQLDGSTIAFPARVNREGFEHGEMAGYHAVVWQGGRAEDAGLFRALVRDVDVLDALEALGAQPGNGLKSASWDERHDPDHPAPKRVISGPKITVLVQLEEGVEPLALARILEDPGGRGFDLRLGGHRALIPEWRSGCVICLYSCPGSKVGNATYTIRDFVDGATRFRARPGVLPEDGTTVQLLLRLAES